MIVTYSPEDGDVQTWEFDPKKVRVSECELIEKRYGGNYEKFAEGVLNADMRARRVLLWHLMRRQHMTLRYEDTPDFYAGELTVEYSSLELYSMREIVEKSALSPEDKDEVLTALDSELSQRDADDEGKAT